MNKLKVSLTYELQSFQIYSEKFNYTIILYFIKLSFQQQNEVKEAY